MRHGVATICATLMLLLAAGFCQRAAADDGTSLEARVKGAFIFNFIQFTQWPDGTFAKADDPLVIGILGETPVADALRAVAATKSVNGRPISVQQFHSIGEIGVCHVLVIANQFSDNLEKTVHDGASRGMLTIGESEAFADAGGVIRLFIEEGKERFEINTLAAERAHLQISSKLLKLARIVRK